MLMIWIAGVLALALGWWAFRRSSSAPATSRPAMPAAAAFTGTPSGAAAGVPTYAAPAPIPATNEPLPAELASLRWLREDDLDATHREALTAAIQGIPRPPASLQQLLSPEFVAKAGSAELSDLVMGEPLIAAKVLGTVNAPFYGLHKPVTGIGQAVTFLGMNTVRSICMQYMLAEAFKPGLASSQKVFDSIWKASAIGSEICVRLGKSLNLPDQGALATRVVLGFVGPLATASLLPPHALNEWLPLGRLARTEREQQLVDLSATEIGGLLMKSWALPQSLVDDVCDAGRLLVTPVAQADFARAPRLALAYLCAHLGEQLALGHMTTLEGFDPWQDTGADCFHLRTYLSHPALAQLGGALQAPDLLAAVQQMLANQPTA
jgi:HD-like signal output (HDOD) protein